ncbi:Heat induced stress protein YflT [Halobacillus karajensis]|uniref:General stress protein 17M n=1 Tax=Halobacillus karajensis TaxID=195088 RepID=A0A024P2H8_9BACI|nr:general stress protein [Halobacillus karajensis]CDQ20004.1 General stress protein 17M [Halobacillus karajensis]CDQ22464.1 General stress protein 17M [Halobacillus karajensis]CDQ28307.1 General stress protein 17M [Halobacillus karajensis]SEH68304.1 Heat induced stress protein YflT [Halobacillus karajensis]
MKPTVREYTNDETLMKDVKRLKDEGIDNQDIYILAHDDDRTDRIAKNVNANTIGLSEQDTKQVVSNLFSKQGDELRTKLQEMGVSEQEAAEYEEDLDEGKVLLLVTNPAKAEPLL